MKHIIKGKSPQELDRWFKAQPVENKRRLNCSYDNMPTAVREIVKQHLLLEQGYLCCYTGIRIDKSKSHIEHLKPQSRCEEHEDINYDNLLAAYPGANSHQCPYGAHIKADWYDVELLVSPLHQNCEQRFRFHLDGRITPADKNDAAAWETIERLKLDHPSLTEMRKQAIDAFIFDSPLSLKKAEQLIESINKRDVKGRFKAFCFVLEKACAEYVRLKKREQARKKAIQQQRPKI